MPDVVEEEVDDETDDEVDDEKCFVVHGLVNDEVVLSVQGLVCNEVCFVVHGLVDDKLVNDEEVVVFPHFEVVEQISPDGQQYPGKYSSLLPLLLRLQSNL